VKKFFTNGAEIMAQADLVISRAGASSLEEIACLGRASIIVPYPYATDNHQYYNSKIFFEKEAAWLVLQENFTVDYLVDLLQDLLNDKNKLQEAGRKAASLFNNGAAKIIEILEQ